MICGTNPIGFPHTVHLALSLPPQLSPIQPALSLAQSPLCTPSQLLLTSTALQKSVLPSPLLQSQPSPGETNQFALHFGSPGQPESVDKESLVSRVKLSQSSSRSEMSSTRVEVVNPAALTTALEVRILRASLRELSLVPE